MATKLTTRVSKVGKNRNSKKRASGGRPEGIPKTGGRRKGTPNQLTREITARLEELGCDPIEGMALIAMDADNPPELRGRMFAELAGYVYPKRKAVEISRETSDQGTFTLQELLETYRRDEIGRGDATKNTT